MIMVNCILVLFFGALVVVFRGDPATNVHTLPTQCKVVPQDAVVQGVRYICAQEIPTPSTYNPPPLEHGTSEGPVVGHVVCSQEPPAHAPPRKLRPLPCAPGTSWERMYVHPRESLAGDGSGLCLVEHTAYFGGRPRMG